MPAYVVKILTEALKEKSDRDLTGAKVLLIGIAYKKNVDDVRESPAFPMIELLEENGAKADFYDPYVSVIPNTREHASLAGRQSVVWQPDQFYDYDAVLICTDHDCIDFKAIVEHAALVVDTRNATKSIEHGREKVVLA